MIKNSIKTPINNNDVSKNINDFCCEMISHTKKYKEEEMILLEKREEFANKKQFF